MSVRSCFGVLVMDMLSSFFLTADKLASASLVRLRHVFARAYRDRDDGCDRGLTRVRAASPEA